MARPICWKAALIAAGTLIAAAGASAPAQTATGAVEGTVTDAGTRRPIASAQVYIVGTQLGSLTGTDGHFRITRIPAGQVQVGVRMIGYGPVTKPVTITAGDTARIDFALSLSAVTLGDVVVTGTGGAVEEKKLGNTVAKVNLADIQNAPVHTPDEVLQGRIPGVNMLPTSGVTGQGARIRIRGNASLTQSNQPIIYIDGVRMDNGGGFGNTTGAAPSSLDNIDPNTIERIEVLKGAAAATLYGTEASNGVIQIFTKAGAVGAPRWTFQLERSAIAYTDRVKPNAGFARTQVQADSLSLLYGQTITPFVPFSYKVVNDLEQVGSNTTLNGSVSGGSQGLRYYFAGRFADEDGAFTSKRLGGLADNTNRRYQGTMNLIMAPRDNLTLNVRTMYSNGHLTSPSGNNNIYSPYALAMYAKPELGYCLDSLGKKSFQNIAGTARCTGAGNPYGNTSFSTVREALQQSIYQDQSHFNSAMTVKYSPTGELSVDATLGIDNINARNVSYWPFGNAVDRFSNNAPDGSRSLDAITTQNTTLDVKGAWNRQLTSRLASKLTVGTQGFIQDLKSSGGSNRNFPGPGLEVVGAGNQPSVRESLLRNVNAGLFGQEQLELYDWIFVTGGARYDYNSAFGESAGGVLYPKASISLVPSDLDRWATTTLSSLRLRAAIGKSGRQPGAFDKFTTYSPLPSQYGGGLVPANLGNPDLKPEVSTETEVGAELGLFSNRVSLSSSYWSRVVNDALVAKQFPLSGGFTQTQLANIGQTRARGVDLSVSGFVVNRPNVAVELFANGAYLWQKVTNLNGAKPLKAGGSYIRYRNFIKEGYAPGALFGAKLMTSCGSYSSAQAASLQAAHLCLAPGEVPFDINGTGRPVTQEELLAYLANPVNPTNLKPLRADDDQNGDYHDHYLGKPLPDWQGGFGGNVTLFSRWRIQTLFEYKAGHYTITNLTDAFRNSSPTLGRNTMEAASVEAVLLDPASTTQQRYDAAMQWLGLVALSPYDGVNQNGNGDFLRWRELSLTYTAPSSVASRLKARDLAITLGARNLLLWTKYTGTDPEINQQGIAATAGPGAASGVDANFIEAVDAYQMPLTRRFTISVRLGY